MSISTTSPCSKEPRSVLLLMNNSKGKPRFNWSVIILSVAFSIKAVAPEVMPVTLRLFNNSILKSE